MSLIENCEPKKQVVTDKGVACCDICSKGFGMVKLCTTTNSTICERCKDGQTFSENISLFDKCQPCGLCDKIDENAVTKARCTASSDTVCECIRGFYMNGSNGTCKKCSKCAVGFGRKSMCTAIKDTACEACKVGVTFSQFSSETSNHECISCNNCPQNYKTTSNCTLLHDTQCQTSDGRIIDAGTLQRLQSFIGGERSKPNLQQRRWIQQQKTFRGMNYLDNNTSVVTNVQTGDHGKNLIPLYCGVMGLLIVGLVVYVIVKYWKGRSSRLTLKVIQNSNTSRGASTCCSVPIQPLLAKNNNKILTIQPWSLTDSASKRARSVDSGLGTELVSAALSTRCFRDVDEELKRQMDIALNTRSKTTNDAGWHQLAIQLGFTDVDIQTFETQALKEKRSAFRCLLERWSADSHNTVGIMLQAVQKINRQDLLILLREEKSVVHPQDVRIDFSSSTSSSNTATVSSLDSSEKHCDVL